MTTASSDQNSSGDSNPVSGTIVPSIASQDETRFENPTVTEPTAINEATPTSSSPTRQVLSSDQTSDRPTASSNAPSSTEEIDLGVTRIEAPKLSGDSTQTWIERADELKHTHAEVTLKPQSVSASQSITKTMGTVVLRQRDVSHGVRGSGGAAEYEIGRRLGEGGMGAVYQARQGAIDRTVALKVIKPKLKDAEELKEKFVAEAIITGDLEHPGIVPIYDLGTNAAGDVFYAMKEVRGTSWKAVIDEKSEAENLEILMRVADAIAFAHSRGVVHRDLKPDNVMIGAFGEVLVMDWGLAMPTAAFPKKGIAYAQGAAGTPSYMAPEMAAGDSNLVGPASDIYLLGALLFRILTGNAPHTGRHALDCLYAAQRNEFVPTDRNDELMQIARRAMAAKPDDRYRTVQEFQSAVREHQAHSDSLLLTNLAENEWRAAIDGAEYRRFKDALAAFKNALRLWAENQRAKTELKAAQLAYARAALERGDLDLASQQLDAHDSEHAELLTVIRAAQLEREAQRHRARRMKQLAVGLAAAVVLVVSISSALIYRSWQQEALAHAEALQRFNESQAAIKQLTGISQDLEYFPRLQGVRQNLLEMAAKHYRELHEHRSNDPDMQLATAQAMLQLGDVRLLLADHKQAQAAFENAAELAKPLAQTARRKDLKHAANLALIASRSKLAECSIHQGEYTAAEANIAAGLEQAEDSGDQSVLATRGSLLLQRSHLQRLQGRWSAAAQDISQAQELFERVTSSARDSTNSELLKDCRINMALSCDQLALVEEQLGQLERAEQASQRAIAIWTDLNADAPDVPTYLEGLASSHVLLGNIQRGFGHDSLRSAQQAIKAYEALVLARPEVPKYQFQLATELLNVAYLQLRAGRISDARNLAIDATNRCVRLANEYPEVIDYADADASSRSILGEVLRDSGDYELAAGKLDEAIELFAERVAQFADVPSYRERLAESLNLRAQVAALNRDTDKARELWERAFATAEPVSGEPASSSHTSAHHGDLIAWLHLHLADDAWSRGEKDLAASHYQAAFKHRESLPKTAELQHHFGWLLAYGLSPESRQPQRAVEFFRQALAVAPSNSDYWFDLAFAQTQAGQWDEAARSVDLGQKYATTPRGQALFIRAVIENHQGQAAAAEQLFRRGSEQLQKVSPGNPRLLRLQRLAKSQATSPDKP